jgi:hypothetical protein
VTNINPPRIIAGLLLCVVVALLSADLFRAITSEACPAGPSCYPWGAEGPAAGAWSYQSKENYLIRGIAQLGLILGAGLFLIRRAGTDTPQSERERLGPCAALAAAALLLFV